MAEVNTGDGGGGKHQKKRAKKSSTRIDMTPMVDLAFLLLTFFVLTSTFAKPKTMEINFPAKPKDEKENIKVNNALTFLLTKDNGIYYYYGEFYPEGNAKAMPPTQLTKTDFSSEGLHKILLDRNKPTIEAIDKLTEQFKKKEIADTTYKRLAVGEKGKKAALTVLIKADDQAIYKNVIDVVDELNICNVAIALLITGASFLFAVSLPAIIDWINNKMETAEVPVDITQVDLTAPPPLDETTPPPPPPPPPPPVMETVKFTPPVVTDEEVKEDPPPVQTEETPQISTVTQEGAGDEQIIIPENTGNGVVEEKIEAPLTIVEQMPGFPGGDGEMMKYIQKNVNYPQVEKEAGISGTCYVTFVVEKDGSITDVKVLRGVSGGPGCDKEAIRVVKSMPSWKPGKQNGREVRVQFNLPIKFTLR